MPKCLFVTFLFHIFSWVGMIKTCMFVMIWSLPDSLRIQLSLGCTVKLLFQLYDLRTIFLVSLYRFQMHLFRKDAESQTEAFSAAVTTERSVDTQKGEGKFICLSLHELQTGRAVLILYLI